MGDDIEKGMDRRFLRILMLLEHRSVTRKELFNEDFIESRQSTKQRRLMYDNPLRMQVRKNKRTMMNADRRGNMKCQVVRSCSSWSIGINETNTEFSIQIAYIQLIAMSKYFIYIENQFFMSSTGHKTIRNAICSAIV